MYPPPAPRMRCPSSRSQLGLLILVFYFTSKKLQVKVHLLVKLELHSKKDLECKQVQNILELACEQQTCAKTLHSTLQYSLITVHS